VTHTQLTVHRTGDTPAGFGIYTFAAVPAPEPSEPPTPWRCASCRWWEVIPEFAIDPSGRHGMCLLAELQDDPEATPDGPVRLRRFLADDGLATAADFGCTDWQAGIVPASEPWLQGAGREGWRFPAVATADRDSKADRHGRYRPAGPVFTCRTPERRAGQPAWACGTCRWYDAPTSAAHGLRGGACGLVAKADLIPSGDDPCVFLLAFAGEDGLDTAADFGCAMWDDERYAGLPHRDR
jgi:hypothetical protein